MVCPALAGMSPGYRPPSTAKPCLPRTRGDEPFENLLRFEEFGSAPHSRG